MPDREVVITYAIRQAAGNSGVFKALGQGTADIQSAYARAGDALVKQAERYAKQIVAAYQNANRTIAGSVSQGFVATLPAGTIPTAAIQMTAQQQAMARAQAKGGTGVSQFLEPPVLRASEPRGLPAGRAASQAGKDAEREAAAAEKAAERKAVAEERAAARAQAAQNKRTVDILRQQEKEAVAAERAAERAARAADKLQQQATRAAEKQSREQERAAERVARTAERAAQQAAKAAEKEARDKERAIERATAAAERAAASAQRAQEKRAADVTRQHERETAAAERAADRTAKAAERAAQQAQKAQNKRTIDILKQQEKEAADAERAITQQAEKAAQNRERFSAGSRKALQGAVSVAEGAAYVGLADEKDTQKLIEGVTKVRGAAMALVGVVDAVDGVIRAMSAVRSFAIAGAAAEAALAAARAQTTAATAASTAAEKGGLFSRIGGFFGRFLPGAGAAAAGVGAGAAGAGTAAAGAAGAGAGGAAVGTGAAAAGGIGVAAMAGLFASAIVSAGAAIGMATNAFGMRDKTAGWMSGSLKTVKEYGENKQVSNIGEYGENRSWSEWIGRWRIFGSQQEEDRATQAVNKTKKAEDERQKRLTAGEILSQQIAAQTEGDDQIAAINRAKGQRAMDQSYRGQGWRDDRQADLSGSRAASEEAKSAVRAAQDRLTEMERLSRKGAATAGQAGDAKRDVEDAQRREKEAAEKEAKENRQAQLTQQRAAQMLANAQKESADERQRLGDLEQKRNQLRVMAAGPDQIAGATAEIEAARQRAGEAAQREAEMAQQRKEIERQIADGKIKAAEASIQKAQQELDLRKQTIAQERERLQTAQERIGGMDIGQREQLKDLARRFRAGAAKDMTEEELRQLEGTGLREFTEGSKAERMRRGKEAFGEIAGPQSEEQKVIEREQQKISKLETTLKDQRELKVSIERDDDALANRLASQISQQLDERDKLLTLKVQDAVRAKLTEINQRSSTESRDSARNGAGGVK